MIVVVISLVIVIVVVISWYVGCSSVVRLIGVASNQNLFVCDVDIGLMASSIWMVIASSNGIMIYGVYLVSRLYVYDV